ncbi:MAG: Ig-like domain-containing protein [Coriobacteriia bacterium]|nr:Ig-like domain-containing protein [Coriobacteriia bacterium]
MATVLRDMVTGRFSVVRAVAVLVVTLAFAGVTAQAYAAVIPMTIEEMASQADAIVLARLGAKQSLRMPVAAPDSNAAPIATDFTFSVLKVLKGSRGKTLSIRQPGGEVGGMGYMVSEVPRFRQGETCYLILDARNNVIGAWQGKIAVDAPDAVLESRLRGGVRVSAPAPEAATSVAVPLAPADSRLAAFWDPATGISPLATTTLFSSGFEGGDMSSWVTSGSGDPTWGPATYRYAGGTGSLFMAASGSNAVVPPATLPSSVTVGAYLKHAAVDLSGYNSAWLDFDIYCNMPSTGWAAACVSTSAANSVMTDYVRSSFTSSSTGWKHVRIDLRNVIAGNASTLRTFTGQSTVYVTMYAGHSWNYPGDEGVYIDNVVLTADNLPLPTVTNVTPANADAGVNQPITITGTNFGATRGTGSAGFYSRGGSTVATAGIVSWSDTSIICTVPAGAGSGPLTVTNGGGLSSTGYTYDVGFSWWGVHRSPSSVAYRVTPSNPTTGVANVPAAVESAMAIWNGGTYRLSSFVFSTDGVSTQTANPPIDNNLNDIYFASTGFTTTSILGWNSYSYDGVTRHVIETDIVMNSAYAWSDGAVPGKYDYVSIMAHELGHSLVLDDQYGAGDVSKVMCGTSPSNSVKRVLSDDDIRGIRYIYGTDMTAPAAPTIASPTHPAPGTWYAATSPQFTYSASDASGIYGWKYALDRSPSTDPGTGTVSSAATSVAFGVQPDGVSYFHVRAVDTFGNWGPVSHFAVSIDTRPLSGDFVLAGGATTVNTRTVTVDSAGVANATSMSVSVDGGSSFDATQAFAVSRSVVLPAGDGVKGVVVRYANAAGNTLSRSHTIVLDATAPGAPELISPTHSDPTSWYVETSPVFQFSGAYSATSYGDFGPAGTSRGLVVDGTDVFTTANSVVDDWGIADPAAPTQVRTSGGNLTGTFTDIAVSGNRVYAVGYSGTIGSIATKFKTAIDGLPTAGEARSFLANSIPRQVRVVGSYAYVACSQAGVKVLNISAPTAINTASLYTVSTVGSATASFRSGNILYVTAVGGGLQISDVTTISAPTTKASLTSFDAYDVDVSGTMAFVACGTGGVRVYDVYDPTGPLYMATIATTGDARQLYRNGTTLYVAEGTAGIGVFDVSDPIHPRRVTTIATTGSALDVSGSGDRIVYSMGASKLGIRDLVSPVGQTYTWSFDRSPTTDPGWATSSTATYAQMSASSDGAWYFHVRANDAVGNHSPVSHRKVLVDSAAPSGAVQLNGGAATTGSTQITANSSVTDISPLQMRFSADDGVMWTEWADYAASASLNSTPGVGVKLVRAQYRDSALPFAHVLEVTDTITVVAPVAPVTNATVSPAAPNGLNGWYREAPAAVSITRDIAGTTYAQWDTTSTWRTSVLSPMNVPWPVTPQGGTYNGTATVTYYGVSGASATSETPSHSLTLKYDGGAPLGDFQLAGGATVTGTTTVSATVTITDNASGPGYVSWSTDGSSWTATSPFSPSVSVTLPAGSGPKSVSMRFWDRAGNIAGLVQTRVISLDQTPPTTTPGYTWGDVAEGSVFAEQADITLNPVDSGGSTVAGTRWVLDGGALQTGTSVTASALGAHTLQFASWDALGNTEVTRTLHFSVQTMASPATTMTLDPPSPDGLNDWYVTTPTVSLVRAWLGRTFWQLDGGSMSAASYDITTTLAGVAQGEHAWAFYSQNHRGTSESPWGSRSIKLDSVKPSTSATVAKAADGTATVTIVGFDAGAGSGSPTVRWTLDGGALQEQSPGGAGLTTTATIPVTAIGSHVIAYCSVDLAGNRDVTRTIEVTVADPNRTPVARDCTYTVSAYTTLTGPAATLVTYASDPDGDPLVFSMVTQPGMGTATVMSTGSITYRPINAYTGTDSFTYRVSDGRGGVSEPATVRIVVTPLATSTYFRTSAYTVARGRAVTLSGYVNPRAFAGGAVRYYVKKPGKRTYAYMGSRTIGSTGVFSYRFTYSRRVARGYYYYQARFYAQRGLKASNSRVVRVRVK